jgi:hypothetical protein
MVCIVAKISRLFNFGWHTGFKLSLAIFLFLTSVAFWKWTGDLFLTAILQLTLTLNSMGLGFIDIYVAPTLILSLWALKARNLLLATVLFSITCLIKWQPVIIAPFVCLYVLDAKGLEDWKQIDFKRLLGSVFLPLLSTLALVLSVFGFEPIHALGRALNDPFLSGYALNFHWVLTYLLRTFFPDGLGGRVVYHATFITIRDPAIKPVLGLGFYLLYMIAFVAFLRREKTFENLILYSLAGYLAYFTFNTGVHENHLFSALILATILFWIDRSHLSTLATWSLIANMNLLMFYGLDGTVLKFSQVVGVDLTFLLSVFSVLLFAVFFSHILIPYRDCK